MIPFFLHHPLQHYLVVAAILFCAGLYTVLTRRNAVSVLMGVELVLNAANLNFVAFARYADASPLAAGNLFVVFTVILAAAEAAVALAIILGIYQNFGSTDVDETRTLKE